jgi:hypothetical protein
MSLKKFLNAMSFMHLAFCVLLWLPALFFVLVAYSDYNMRGCYYHPDGGQCSEAFGVMMIASFVLAGPFFHLFYGVFRKTLKGAGNA